MIDEKCEDVKNDFNNSSSKWEEEMNRSEGIFIRIVEYKVFVCKWSKHEEKIINVMEIVVRRERSKDCCLWRLLVWRINREQHRIDLNLVKRNSKHFDNILEKRVDTIMNIMQWRRNRLLILIMRILE